MMAVLGLIKMLDPGSFVVARGAPTRTTVAPPIATATSRRIASTSVFELFVYLREDDS